MTRVRPAAWKLVVLASPDVWKFVVLASPDV
jgi:hypothetical protein